MILLIKILVINLGLASEKLVNLKFELFFFFLIEILEKVNFEFPVNS